VDEIAEALFVPQLAEQAVVSMLQELGIGLYKDDGTAIRVGTEQSDSDFFLFESEARGLIDMLKEQDEPDTWITFRDFHAALAGQGLQDSPEELLASYVDAYAEAPDDPIARFVTTTAALDLDASFTRFGAWMLLLDGFVPPNAQSARVSGEMAALGGFVQQPPPRHGWGATFDRRRQGSSRPPMSVNPSYIAHLMTILANFSVIVTPGRPLVHEGHGGSGEQSVITAIVKAAAGAFVSPFTGTSLVPVNPNPAASLHVKWLPDAFLTKHGMASPLTDTTGPIGGVRTTYTARQEPANGQGAQMSQTGTITASVPSTEIIDQLYNLPGMIPGAALGALVPAELTGTGNLVVQWHDEVIRVEFVNRYDVTFITGFGDTHTSGTDTFNGELSRTDEDEGRWAGSVSASAVGNFSGSAFGQPGCSSSWNAQQQLLVIGTEDRTKGTISFQFYPGLDPTGSQGRGRCPPTIHKRNGQAYAPFNDLIVTGPDDGLALVAKMPPKPGGQIEVIPVNSPPGVTSIKIKNTSWTIKITFPPPGP